MPITQKRWIPFPTLAGERRVDKVVEIPPRAVIIFHQNLEHAGGASDCLNHRLFGCFGTSNFKAG